ncbi:hypothetical protein E4O86_22245 [Rhizobiales bacterium L72]|uniref:Serine/threonine protein kinase n=1 Tax=Propylenella binzhouense TaxID=2555902 RepID=A0A964T8C9_9HYPH|nr:hypothetical protein [Propylenella binzhouense]
MPSVPPAGRGDAGPRGRSSRALLYAALVLVIAGAGAGAYLSGLLDPFLASAPPREERATLTPAEQPPQGTAKPAGSGEDVAALTPGAGVEPPPSARVSNVAQRIAWLQDYSGGDCFYATATNASEDTIDVEGFGTSAQPFDKLLESFEAAYQIEPNIGVRLINQSQCAVADFLKALAGSPEARPIMTLSSDVIRSGDAIQGSAERLNGRRSEVYLVDNEGVVYSLEPHLRRTEDSASFNIKLGLATPEPVPQLVLVLVSGGEIGSAKLSEPVLASAFFPRILEEIERRNIRAAAAAKYFKLGG